jgi:hypothetical protein
MKNQKIDLADFGKTDQEVTIVGLGGEGVLRTHGQEREAREVILEAVRNFPNQQIGQEG